MVRLYIDISFEVGGKVQIPDSELHYFRQVRRARGPVELFNRQSQIARGELEGQIFVIQEVLLNPTPVIPLTLAVGLPEKSVISQLIPDLSELGVERLVFFPAERSQSAKKRDLNLDRLERLSIESSRQCGRGSPLQVEVSSWDKVLNPPNGFLRICFDEAQAPLSSTDSPALAQKVWALVGCEGGWTQRERDEIRANRFQVCHFHLPVMRVGTAAIVASAFCGFEFFRNLKLWSFESMVMVDPRKPLS